MLLPILGILSWSTVVYGVDIATFDEPGCDMTNNSRQFTCPHQPEHICCGFPSIMTETDAVGFSELGEGDIATWFHEGQPTPVAPTPGNPNPRPIRNHCGGIRRSQVMMGSMRGQLCMNAHEDVHAAVSDDGANWYGIILIKYQSGG